MPETQTEFIEPPELGGVFFTPELFEEEMISETVYSSFENEVLHTLGPVIAEDIHEWASGAVRYVNQARLWDGIKPHLKHLEPMRLIMADAASKAHQIWSKLPRGDYLIGGHLYSLNETLNQMTEYGPRVLNGNGHKSEYAFADFSHYLDFIKDLAFELDPSSVDS